ncbi:MAG: type II toxin-antitoxin system RelE/ParE family toxin [Steroidobacteraceae bacterium]
MRVTVELTAHFESTLDSIKTFLDEQAEPQSFARLLEHLFDELIPNLQAFPHMGRDFMQQPVRSLAVKTKLRRLKASMGKNTEIREYIADDYLVLYAIRQTKVYLLSIRHHRQLSFDLKSHWS